MLSGQVDSCHHASDVPQGSVSQIKAPQHVKRLQVHAMNTLTALSGVLEMRLRARMSLNATQRSYMVRDGRIFSIITLNHTNDRASERSGGGTVCIIQRRKL